MNGPHYWTGLLVLDLAVFLVGCHCTYPSPSQGHTANRIERTWPEPQSFRLWLGDHCTSYLEAQGKEVDAWGWIHGQSETQICNHLRSDRHAYMHIQIFIEGLLVDSLIPRPPPFVVVDVVVVWFTFSIIHRSRRQCSHQNLQVKGKNNILWPHPSSCNCQYQTLVACVPLSAKDFMKFKGDHVLFFRA